MKLYQYGSSLKYNILGKSDKCKDFDYIVENINPVKREIFCRLIHMIADEVTSNSFGGLKLKMRHGTTIDIGFCNDMTVEYRQFMELNSDGLFYDVQEDEFFIPESFYKDYTDRGRVYVIEGAVSHPIKAGRTRERMAHAIALQPLLLANNNNCYRYETMVNASMTFETQLLLELIAVCNLDNVGVMESMIEYYRETKSILNETVEVNEKLK